MVVERTGSRQSFWCPLWSFAVLSQFLSASKFEIGTKPIPARNAVLLDGWLPPLVFLEETSCDSPLLGCIEEGRVFLYLPLLADTSGELRKKTCRWDENNGSICSYSPLYSDIYMSLWYVTMICHYGYAVTLHIQEQANPYSHPLVFVLACIKQFLRDSPCLSF